MEPSCLMDALLPLKESSKAAIADAVSDKFDDVKAYLHLTRNIEYELLEILEKAKDSSRKQLILVCGNVGDGKSHVISYLQREWTGLQSDFKIHDDATESSHPKRTFLDELYDLLEPFEDTKLDSGQARLILAINLGTLNNFLVDDNGSRFSRLGDYVKRKKIFEIGMIEDNMFDSDSSFQHVNFCDHNLFVLSPDGPKSPLIEDAIKNVVNSSNDNPFYKAYEKHKKNHPANCPVHYNFELLQRPEIRSQISDLLIECIVRNHLIISIRALYNFIYDLIVPVDLSSISCDEAIKRIENYSEEDFLKAIIPNYIFDHPELSSIFAQLQAFDPATKRSAELDNCVIELMVSADKEAIFTRYLPLEKVGKVFHSALKKLKDEKDSVIVSTFIRSAFFWEGQVRFGLHDDLYHDFMRSLYGWYSGDTRSLKPVYRLIQHTITNWFGMCPDGHINLEVGRQQLKYRISEVVQTLPAPLPALISSDDDIKRFQLYLPLCFRNDGETITLDTNYRLFDLACKMKEGYCPTRKDHGDFVHFSKFIESVGEVGEARECIHFSEANGKQYVLELDTFGDFCFKAVQI